MSEPDEAEQVDRLHLDEGRESSVGAVSSSDETVPAKEADTLNSAGHSEDEFGDFDEFGEFEEGSVAASSPADSEPAEDVQKPASTTFATPAVEGMPLNSNATPLKSAQLTSDSAARLVTQFLTAPPKPHSGVESDGTTPTSQQLWQHLTETTWMPLPDWKGSRIHKQLTVSLGVPLNLDESLPKVTTRRMALPSKAQNGELEGLQNLPQWSILAAVSPEALESMSEEELLAHISTLESASATAGELREALDSAEMDLVGERNILEGMVESLLVYSQQNQRERIRRRTSKSRR